MIKEDNADVVFCKRCGRELHDDYSKKVGFGPCCYTIWKKEQLQRIRLFDEEGRLNERGQKT